MIRAELSTGVLQIALAAFKLRSEVAESLTGVLQNAFLIPQASQRIGRIVDRGLVRREGERERERTTPRRATKGLAAPASTFK